MAHKLLLNISPAQTVAGLWQGNGRGGSGGGEFTRCEVFAPDDEGLAAFAVFLKGAGKVLSWVAADTVEEDYRFDTLPHAGGSDRAALLDRKIRHYYRSTRFVCALHRERTADKRRDDRYLFTALTNPALIDPWLAELAKADCPVAGVHLAPMLSSGLLARLNIAAPRVLLAIPQRSGLRLTFHKGGEFCTSRLTRPIPANAADAVQMLQAELINTRMYLSTLNFDALDEPLPVVFLDHDDTLAPIVPGLNEGGHGTECQVIGRARIVQYLGVSPRLLDVAPETLYLRQLAEQPPEANLAPASITAGYRMQRQQQALYAAAAGIAAVGVLGAGFNLWRSADFNQGTLDAARRTAAAQSQYKEITRTFPAAPTTADNLVKAVDIYQNVVKAARTPRTFMEIVSRAVEPSPEIYLNEIAWVHGGLGVQSAQTGARTDAPASAIVATAAIAPPATDSLRQSGSITGELRPFNGDFRAAIAAIQGVADRLSRDSRVAEVRVAKLPLNVNPEQSLSGNTRDDADQSGAAAEFRIAITLKPNV